MSTEASHLQCLCGAINEPASLLASSTLPIETELCHCNICRRTTGALAATFANLKGSPSTKSLEACTRNSKSGWRVERYYCSICGTRVFDHATDTGNWLACSGIVEPQLTEGEHPHAKSENVVKIVSHDFVGDTGDGGLAGIMRRLGGRDISCIAQGEGTGMQEGGFEALTSKPLTYRADALHASCHCGAIQFEILPPPPDALQRPENVRDGSMQTAPNTVAYSAPAAAADLPLARALRIRRM